MRYSSLLCRVVTATVLVGALSGVAQARVLDSRDGTRVANESAARWTRSAPGSRALAAQLEAEGIHEEQAARVIDSINARALGEMRRFAVSLEGQSADSPEDLAARVTNRERILRFDILSNPRAYAAGKPMTFVMNDAQLTRYARGLMATWIEHEPALREKVDELVMMQDLAVEDVPAIRALARERVLSHAKDVLAGMRGAAFFASSDADYYLETAFDEEIDHIRGEYLSDPVARASFLEHARITFGVASNKS